MSIENVLGSFSGPGRTAEPVGSIPPPVRKGSRTGTALTNAHHDEVERWFGSGRRWRICTELDGPVSLGEDKPSAIFRRGEFTLDTPWTFLTPLGRRGTAGVVIQEVDEAGNDVPGSRATFGMQQLKRVARQYNGCVTNLPTRG